MDLIEELHRRCRFPVSGFEHHRFMRWLKGNPVIQKRTRAPSAQEGQLHRRDGPHNLFWPTDRRKCRSPLLHPKLPPGRAGDIATEYCTSARIPDARILSGAGLPRHRVGNSQESHLEALSLRSLDHSFASTVNVIVAIENNHSACDLLRIIVLPNAPTLRRSPIHEFRRPT